MAEEEEGVDDSSYLRSHRDQETLKEESHRQQIREASRDIQAAVHCTEEQPGQ